ncbi:MAG: hypothetical protein CMJ88_05365 [Planctomycetes bacterium]|nr:hypothetical protein [Planctomycetota bacterium]
MEDDPAQGYRGPSLFGNATQTVESGHEPVAGRLMLHDVGTEKGVIERQIPNVHPDQPPRTAGTRRDVSDRHERVSVGEATKTRSGRHLT